MKKLAILFLPIAILFSGCSNPNISTGSSLFVLSNSELSKYVSQVLEFDFTLPNSIEVKKSDLSIISSDNSVSFSFGVTSLYSELKHQLEANGFKAKQNSYVKFLNNRKLCLEYVDNKITVSKTNLTSNTDKLSAKLFELGILANLSVLNITEVDFSASPFSMTIICNFESFKEEIISNCPNTLSIEDYGEMVTIFNVTRSLYFINNGGSIFVAAN